jgi:hypothetical protein
VTRYSRGAAMLGQNPLFREFLTSTTGRPVPDADTAAAETRLACGVVSRKALDTDVDAGRRYLDLVERFNDWLGARNA